VTTPFAAEQQVQTALLGRKYPNLVLLYDSEKGYEFRVQCEVVFNENNEEEKKKATRVKDLLVGKKPSKKDLEEIRDIVKKQAKDSAGASDTFLQIIDLAVGNQEPLRQSR
jgi:hypothetical protein